jgi:hypothetical protein
MSNPSTVSYGNVRGTWILGVTLSPASVANATSAEQTFAVTGLLLGDNVDCNKPTFQAGLSIVNSRVSANGVLAIAFQNVSSASITPTAAEVYNVVVMRPENVSLAGVPTGMTQIVS